MKEIKRIFVERSLSYDPGGWNYGAGMLPKHVKKVFEKL